MEYITLNNGVKMPTEGIGTFLLTPDEAESAVVSALHSGATLIDTANAYVNEKAVKVGEAVQIDVGQTNTTVKIRLEAGGAETEYTLDGRLSPQKRPCVLSVLRLFAGKRDLSGAVRAL